MSLNRVLLFLSYLAFLIFHSATIQAQTEGNPAFLKAAADTMYVYEVEDKKEPDKVLHAEPLYIDLIRDLGARKGEQEWNVGVGLTDHLHHDRYTALVEYEWAPINRLGLEVEVPFTFYTRNQDAENKPRPSNRLESLKTAFQYTFFVSQKLQTSMAFGYINELELVDLNKLSTSSMLKANVYNPFFIVARRWGYNFHSLLYTGPRIEQAFAGNQWHTAFEVNTNVHYMITGTKNFIGIELNKSLASQYFDMVIRPQMRVSIADNLLIGIVAGIPVNRNNERLSSFIRLIYEPKHKH
jgi:hypothetical protein